MSRGKKLLRTLTAHQDTAHHLANNIPNGKKLIARRSAENDAERLRGIPVQAKGVSGTMRGTRPDGWINHTPDQ